MGLFDGMSDQEAMSPRGGGMFERAFQARGIPIGARRERQQQEIISRVLNEEINAQIGDSNTVNLQEAVPQAYFRAARRIAALGNPSEAQKLYNAGLEAVQSTAANAAELGRVKAQTDNLNEAQSEYLEVLRQRDETTRQAQAFEADTPTGAALRSRLEALNERLVALNERGVGDNIPSLPREIVLGAQFEADRAANEGQPGAAERVWARERMTSSRAQDYALGGEGEGYRDFTPEFQEQLAASGTLGSENMKTLLGLEEQAQAAKSSLRTVASSLKLIDEGVRSGPGVDVRQYIARGLAEFFGDDPSAATVNTDVYMAAAGPRVLAEARKLAPVTELDVSRIEQIVAAGLNNTTPEAIREALKIIADAQTNIITRYNTRLSDLGPSYTNLKSFKPVDAPQIDFTPRVESKAVGELTDAELAEEARRLGIR